MRGRDSPDGPPKMSNSRLLPTESIMRFGFRASGASADLASGSCGGSAPGVSSGGRPASDPAAEHVIRDTKSEHLRSIGANRMRATVETAHQMAVRGTVGRSPRAAPIRSGGRFKDLFRRSSSPHARTGRSVISGPLEVSDVGRSPSAPFCDRPSLRILAIRVVRLSPSRAAAPLCPPTTQFV